MTGAISGVVLTEGCRDLRRRVGAMAWTVLEDLALDAVPDDGGVMVAHTSARRVADHLDIQPGTAARALARLRDEGLVRLAREVGPTGRFGLSVYRLVTIPGLTFTDVAPPRVDPPVMARPHVARPNVAPPGWGWARSSEHADDCGRVEEKHAAAPVAAPVRRRATAKVASGAATRSAPAGSTGRSGRGRRAGPAAGQQATLWDEPT